MEETMTESQIGETLDTLDSNVENVEETSTIEENPQETTETEPSDEKENVNADTPEAPKEETKEDKPRFNSLEEALKGYANLEKKLGQQGSELGELRKRAKQWEDEQLQIANNYGFETVEAMRNAQQEQKYSKQLAEFEANEYAKYLDKSEYPDEMRRLLMSYAQNPTKETLELIEADFPLEVVKAVAGQKMLAQGQIEQQRQAAYNQQIETSARSYLDENVNKYPDKFKNEAFTNLYGEAFRAYGCDLDTEKFINLLDAYAQSVIQANNITNGIHKENNQITDEIAGLVNSNSVANIPKDINKMSEKELNAYIRNIV